MITITNKAIDINELLNYVSDRGSGATVLFTGTVRDHNEQNKVSKLYYEVYHAMAEKIIREIENEVRTKWKINKFIAIHRTGTLRIGEISVSVAVSSEHRKEAFEACKFGIDSIKEKAPIWKKEFDESGAEWLEGVVTNR
ncbi:molybdenum cofactor biosynthesis protein MoaE [Nitrosopumilus sp.]|uniref:molybdenum cofactor biosynthesis protein MoaE n=1 Tax=Nitrosopumilus sp. TaxID=2024843 RepID=UPI0029302264|nr:molybdenum cofactor biosynthesis protein MoaE [Nitrosopumilus sp.]